MIKDVKKVTVKYNERIVGYLAEIEPSVIGFQYDDEWVKNGFSISPLSLPLDNKVYISKKELFNGLYGVFWDSLPDGWGELLMNRILTKNGINPNKLSILTKLSLINKNGLGGLTYEPSQPFEFKQDNLDFDKLSDEVQKILNDESESVDLDFVYGLGGSSGGARPKAHIMIDNEEW
ncbi:MAG: HipA N-terminal domain-containing protein, partial [Clostridia bacterium]|nr:HipA N-terminal domain-containing protein [Clostridia bacterium]